MIDKLVANILEWAAGHADEGRYSPVAIVFHWVMAGLVVFQLALGWWMGRAPVGAGKVGAHDLHYAIGLVMLVLVVCRGGWRLLAPPVINDADKPGLESLFAHVGHYVFYICLFGLPLSGWAMLSATAREEQLLLAGITPWPLMPFQELTAERRWQIEAAAEWMHFGLVVSLLMLIPVHVAAALKHHFIDRDDVFHGMLPIVPQRPRRRTGWQRRYRAWEKQVGAQASRLWRSLRAASPARPRSP
ncbi:cytochrome B [Phenylobacterium sp. Root77]|jgi:cytochrome b561|uniref:cytochrome b n=1 Tax=unclassified Phenylobacterium TaxID=2640670 RepID=UPI0006FEEF88|nr:MULTISPECIES: cytochrome b [unclassified Phenylobacterium]KQW66934.1 cytochrome B [Phenylobacterium sp. Root1277]KQW89628.1 cytochrome B [Phenylobacterium sp. Root1290]KRC43503.1 cytochrome B [Phenylobacterium sp. Root77]